MKTPLRPDGANLVQRYLVGTRAASTNTLAAKNPFVLKPKYADFQKTEEKRIPFGPELPIVITKTPNPAWKYGDGSIGHISKGGANRHTEVDANRPMIENYRLLVSGIPRPVSFVSTVSETGHKNLAPFSYFQVVDHDPPIFVIGFSARADRLKDTRRNLEETGECVISIVSEHMVDAVNATSLDVPHGTSEWGLSGFHPVPSRTVKPERVDEAIFSIEGKLLEMKSLDYHGHAQSGKPTGALAIIEGKRFWVRDEALNEAQDEIDLSKLRPVVQLGGIQYARVRETFELPRPSLDAELADERKGLSRFLRTEEGETDER
ncbi:nitrilotriacetate monooxygenase component b [Phlyctema vagabunda]|uniref:Nitrilotriacetate monooxygenase component b n=1 Tax=Phlyctema vagabunda TaxID=108571 RepID=A0ABR4P1R0_9HELO